MKMRNSFVALCACTLLTLTGCMGGSSTASSGRGGEVVGVGGGKAFKEPAPFGMTMVKRGFLKMGIDQQDTLWGKETPVKEISVDGFWMDETEVTNSKYKQFVFWVRDSILRERLADPAYGGDESYKITEDKNGDPVTPHLDWRPSPVRNRSTPANSTTVTRSMTTPRQRCAATDSIPPSAISIPTWWSTPTRW